MIRDTLYTLVMQVAFMVTAISALADGERIGVLMSFVAMLLWACGKKECDEWERLAMETFYSAEEDDMALPAGKSCADCKSFERCRALIGARHIHDQQRRCDWAPSRFRARDDMGASDA